MKDVFSYMNYRDLIKDYYKAKKRSRSPFSYQLFATKAGFSTKTYLIEVTTGKKKLSKNSLFNVAKAMGLKKKETEYFETLVNFNHSTQLKEKEIYFERLITLAGKSTAKKIEYSHYGFFSNWYHMVVRELVTMKDFKGNLNEVARKIKPRISLKDVKNSIKLLLSLGMIKKTASGKFNLSDSSLTTGDELYSLALLQHQQKVIQLGSEALERIPPGNRDISTLSGSVSEEGFNTIKNELQIFRKYLQGIMEKDINQDRVYQVNFQLFPLTEIPKND